MKKHLILIFTMPLLLAACSDMGDPVDVQDGDDPGDTPVSFSADLQPILDARCLSCHGANFPQGGLTLDAASNPENLVGVESPAWSPELLVKAGDREASVLYLKLMGDASYGTKMPVGSSLDADEIELFGRWMDEGAEDN